MHSLEDTARALVAEGKGILAADESDGTIKKRFDSIDVESTEDNRRAYRDLLFTTEGAEEFISGVILYDETIRQSARRTGRRSRSCSRAEGIIPGIKVDKGAKPLARRDGRDDHRGARRAARAARGVPRARRALREVARRDLDRRRASRASTASGRTRTRSRGTRRSARRPVSSRSSSPRCCMDGDAHDRGELQGDRPRAAGASTPSCTTSASTSSGTLLKPNMVLSGYDASDRAGAEEVADATLECFCRHVPAAVPGIVFLSGGQTDEDATAHLNAMNARGPHPWELSFSYGRALQAPALKAWARRSRRTSRRPSRPTTTARR